MGSFCKAAWNRSKAPLRGVHNYAQLLLSNYADKLDATGRRYAESVNKAANNMRLLIDDLLIDDLPIRAGLLPVPPGPGLGVELDQQALDSYCIRGFA